MAAINWANVLEIAPELASVSVGFQTSILKHVNKNVAVDIFDGEDGDDTKLARQYLAAHMGTFFADPSGMKIIAETEGGISRQYANSEGLENSSYGSFYARMCRLNAGGGWVA